MSNLKTILAILSSSTLAVVVACSSDGKPTNEELTAQFASAACAGAYRCMSSYPGSDFATRFGSNQAACVTTFEANANDNAAVTAAIDAALADGKITIDEAAKSKCLAYFSSTPCATIFTMNPPCDNVAIGHVAIGGACTVVVEMQGSNTTISTDIGECVTGASCDSTTKKCVADTGSAAPARTPGLGALTALRAP